MNKRQDEIVDGLSADERNAIAMWTQGLGDMNKSLRGESPLPDKTRIALKSSWKTKRMPRRHHVRLDVDIQLTEEELARLVKGHIPEVMEDHWFMYFDGEYINYYRSWTGICIYRGRVSRKPSGIWIDGLYVNRLPEQYRETNDEKDALLFEALVKAEVGKDASVLRERIFACE